MCYDSQRRNTRHPVDKINLYAFEVHENFIKLKPVCSVTISQELVEYWSRSQEKDLNVAHPGGDADVSVLMIIKL